MPSKTARQNGVTLEGAQHEYERCLANDVHDSAWSKETALCFVYLGSGRHVVSMERSKYPVVQREDFSSLFWVLFGFHSLNTAETFQIFPVGLRVQDIFA